MLTLIRRRRERAAARDAYFAADKKLGNLDDYLGATDDPRERGKALRKMADLEMDQCRRYRAAFGRDVTDEGITMTDSLRFASMLYRALADVEHVIACNGQVGRNWRIREIGDFTDEVLDEMAATPDLAARATLLEPLYYAVVHRVGGQAAEVLWTLPSPGHSGWLTVAEKDEWFHGQGLGPSHATMQRLRRLVGKG